jgi:hypothetical protein
MNRERDTHTSDDGYYLIFGRIKEVPILCHGVIFINERRLVPPLLCDDFSFLLALTTMDDPNSGVN